MIRRRPRCGSSFLGICLPAMAPKPPPGTGETAETNPMKIISAAGTDRGRIRENNEDSVLAEDDIALYAVADGIGGHRGGEVASRLAIETLRMIVRESVSRGFDPETAEATLDTAFTTANARIVETGSQDPSLAGMGTTMTALLMTGKRAYVAHLGDSRAYLLRDGSLRQVTEDHAVVAEQVRAGLITPEQARRSPLRHIITRALGIQQEVHVDHRTIELGPADVFLLCTDGLTEMVEGPEIESILIRDSPAEAVVKLIAAANVYGGADNITVVVVARGELP